MYYCNVSAKLSFLPLFFLSLPCVILSLTLYFMLCPNFSVSSPLSTFWMHYMTLVTLFLPFSHCYTALNYVLCKLNPWLRLFPYLLSAFDMNNFHVEHTTLLTVMGDMRRMEWIGHARMKLSEVDEEKIKADPTNRRLAERKVDLRKKCNEETVRSRIERYEATNLWESRWGRKGGY